MTPQLQLSFMPKNLFLKTYPILTYGENQKWFAVKTLDGKVCALTLKTVSSPQIILKRFQKHTLIKKTLELESTLPCLLVGTPLQQEVWTALLDVPKGQTWSYQQLATHLGRPKAVRAVANAVGANPISPLIPCHRILRSNNQLGGYFWGIDEKIRLLQEEGSLPRHLAL
jgi:O-6-methylguanine DNA methyltransferase